MKLKPDTSPLLDLSAYRSREEYERYAPMWPRLLLEGVVLGTLALVIVWLVMAL